MSDLPPVAYSRPNNVEAALAALSRPGARIYAGGTDFLVALTERRPWVRSVRELVDIKDLDAAKGISAQGSHLRIGSLTTAGQLAASALVRRHAGALAEAAELTSAPMLRRRGTIGGNLVTDHPAGDVTTALLALDASVDLADGEAVRTLLVSEFISTRFGDKAGSDLILAVRVPKCRHSAFEKLGSRSAFSRSIVAVAVALRGSGFRVAIGGMAERPFLAERTSSALGMGYGLTAALAIECSPPDDGVAVPAARLRLAEVLIERARVRAAES